MILSDDFLLGVLRYEALDVAGTNGHYTHFVFHFPQWWKRRKVVKIHWDQKIVVRRDATGAVVETKTWEVPKEVRDMRSRLIFHFQTRRAA